MDKIPEVEALLNRIKSKEQEDLPGSVLKTVIGRMMNVTPQELAAAVASNPDHPKAKEFADTLRRNRFPDDYTLSVEKEDLQGIIEDKHVHTRANDDGHIEKYLGKVRSPKEGSAKAAATTTLEPAAEVAEVTPEE